MSSAKRGEMDNGTIAIVRCKDNETRRERDARLSVVDQFEIKSTRLNVKFESEKLLYI